MLDDLLNDSERQKWLDSLKAGDEVAYKADYGREWRTSSVTKRTKSGRIAVGLSTYNRDGTLRGESGPYRIEPVTQEIRDDMRKKSLAFKLSRCKWDTLSLAALEQVFAIARDDLQEATATGSTEIVSAPVPSAGQGVEACS